MEFSREEYGSRSLFLSPGDLLDEESKLGLLHCRPIFYHLSHQGSHIYDVNMLLILQVKLSSIFMIPDKQTEMFIENHVVNMEQTLHP